MTVPPALLSHESTEHYTPQYILDAVIACMGAIDLDPAATAGRSRTYRQRGIIQLRTTGLCSRGRGGSFSIPHSGPVSSGGSRKLYLERSAGRTTEAIVLWKSATETAAWKTLTAISCRVCFPSARIRFSVLLAIAAPGRRFHQRCFMSGRGRSGSRGVCWDRGGVGCAR